MLKAILFDLDGTLVNTDPLHYKVWQEILQNHQIEIDEVFYKNRISGRQNPDLIADILPDLSPEEGIKLGDFKEAQFRERGSELKPLAGLLDFLDQVKKYPLKTGLVTNAPRLNVEFLLSVLQLTEEFDRVVLGEDAPAGKPDPAPYLLALEKLQISADEAIAFEDSLTGIQASVAAGIYTVGVASTHEPQSLYEAGAKAVIPDFTEVLIGDLWPSK